MNAKAIARATFLISSVYDFVLGIAFLLFYRIIFQYFDIAVPQFPEYLHMSAAFVATLGIGYFFVYKNIDRNRDLWLLGILYKLVYVSIVAYHYYGTSTANDIFLVFAAIDALFLIPFIALYPKVYGKKSS